MGSLNINKDKCNLCKTCISSCPFGALEIVDGVVEANAACKLCRICIKKCPLNAISLIEEQRKSIDKSLWKGVMVFVEHTDGELHPVTLELIGKAKELAAKIDHPVYCIIIGEKIIETARELINYGVDKVFVYDQSELKHYRVDLYANAFEDCIRKNKPSIVLVGATSVGRSLAPRLSTRFRTGLTADCTVLDVKANTDLVQIRPAFGGNIMAQIVTPNSRPQFATVRYKVLEQAGTIDNPKGSIELCHLTEDKLKSKIKVLEVSDKEKQLSITDSEVLVVAGRGIKDKKDLALLEELSELMGGQLAVTRPLVEAGWVSYTKQIGLSGRTVKPKLIITCGISGAVQFSAGINGSECIIAINNDKYAPIFDIAHYGIVGDLYDILPELIGKIKGGKEQYAI